MTNLSPDWAERARTAPWLRVQVAPALYAGPGTDRDAAMLPLLDLGAARIHVPAGPGPDSQFIVSTCGRVRLGYAPADEDTAWKIAVHDGPFHPVSWTVHFSGRTPTEVVKAVTTEVAARLSSDRRLHASAADPEWRDPFEQQGWTITWDPTSQLETVSSKHRPDDTVVLNACAGEGDWEDEAGQDGFWSVLIGEDSDGWSANASTSTPDWVLHLIATTMLTPATRSVHDLAPLALGAAAIGAAELTELPPPQVTYTETDLRWAAAELCEEVLVSLQELDFEPGDCLADTVIPSTAATAMPLTWGRLGREHAALAETLVTDLVVSAAADTSLLMDIYPDPDFSPRYRSTKPTPQVTGVLAELPFINADLASAANLAAQAQIEKITHRRAFAEDLGPLAIQSSTSGAKWRALAAEDFERAVDGVAALLETALTRTDRLFAQPVRPYPLSQVAPMVLSGPGHSHAAAAQVLLDAGWTGSHGAGASIYRSPAPGLTGVSVPAAPGPAWDWHFTTGTPEQPVWAVYGVSGIPSELVTAINKAITTGDPDGTAAAANPLEALAPLSAAGWRSSAFPEGHLSLTPPGVESASVHYTPPNPSTNGTGADGNWQVRAGVLNSQPSEGWSLYTEGPVPQHVVRAIATAISDQSPVERLGRTLTPQHLDRLEVRDLDRHRTPAARPAAARSTSSTRPPHRASASTPPGPTPSTPVPRTARST